jgi:ADP-heptose:LPS heptosyltransferase
LNKVLVIHLHGIGDWMMFSSSLRELERKDYKIDVITGLDPTYLFLKENNYNILYHQNLRKNFSAIKIFFFVFFNASKYQHVFITAGMKDIKLFFFQFAFLLKRNVSALTNESYPIFFVNKIKYDFNYHKTINNQKLVFKYLNIENYIQELPYYLPALSINNIQKSNNKAVVIHPGNDAKNSFRRYPIDMYIELIRLILFNNKASEIFIILGPGELNLEEILLDGLFDLINSHKIKIIKSPKFIDIIQLFLNSSMFITNDSGLAHIAAASNIKIINIYGPANPSDTSPISHNQIIVKPTITLECMPCVKVGGKHGCNDRTCLRSINPKVIYDLVK